jgi:hypothetical protein
MLDEQMLHLEFIYIIWASLLQEIELKAGQIQKNQKSRVRGVLKEFIKSTSIGNELVRYKAQVEQLRSDFMVSQALQIYLYHSSVFQADVCCSAQCQWCAHFSFSSPI